MNRISFLGNIDETTGSIADKTGDSSKNESTGSVGYKRYLSESINGVDKTPSNDTVCFKGAEDGSQKGSSVLGWLFGLGIIAAVTVGGLGYAKKLGWIDKIGNETVKKYTDKIASPCHKACAKLKGWCVKGWEKIKNVFSKKKD